VVSHGRVELTHAAIKNRIAKDIDMQLGRLGDVVNGSLRGLRQAGQGGVGGHRRARPEALLARK
jgi:hypothetical protein